MNAIQLSLLIKDKIITSIYTGDEHGCRCGCHGRYFKPGEKGFTRALNKAKDLDPIISTFDIAHNEDYVTLNQAIDRQIQNEYDGTVRGLAAAHKYVDEDWIDICTGNGKTITIYYKAA